MHDPITVIAIIFFCGPLSLFLKLNNVHKVYITSGSTEETKVAYVAATMFSLLFFFSFSCYYYIYKQAILMETFEALKRNLSVRLDSKPARRIH